MLLSTGRVAEIWEVVITASRRYFTEDSRQFCPHGFPILLGPTCTSIHVQYKVNKLISSEGTNDKFVYKILYHKILSYKSFKCLNVYVRVIFVQFLSRKFRPANENVNENKNFRLFPRKFLLTFFRKIRLKFSRNSLEIFANFASKFETILSENERISFVHFRKFCSTKILMTTLVYGNSY